MLAVMTITNFGNERNTKLLQLQFGCCFVFKSLPKVSYFPQNLFPPENIQDTKYSGLFLNINITHEQEQHQLYTPAVTSIQTDFSVHTTDIKKTME